jgi:hypothetical protein
LDASISIDFAKRMPPVYGRMQQAEPSGYVDVS